MSEPERDCLIILFGQPGAGKSYAGALLQAEFGFVLYEADDDLPEAYRALAAAGQVAPESMRDDYHRLVIDQIAARRAGGQARLAVAAPLLRDRHRQWLRQRFPDAVFVLVEAGLAVRELRLSARTHAVTAEYARRVMHLYEPPTVPYVVIGNDGDGADVLRQQLAALLTQLAGGQP